MNTVLVTARSRGIISFYRRYYYFTNFDIHIVYVLPNFFIGPEVTIINSDCNSCYRDLNICHLYVGKTSNKNNERHELIKRRVGKLHYLSDLLTNIAAFVGIMLVIFADFSKSRSINCRFNCDLYDLYNNRYFSKINRCIN